MKRRTGCKAKQYNDQMQCGDCGVAWDVNDTDAPACKKREVGNHAIAQLLQAVEVKPNPDVGLLFFQPMPLSWLPADIKPGLYRTNWPDYPQSSYMVIDVVDLAVRNRNYNFFTTTGWMFMQVSVYESTDERMVWYRNVDEAGNCSKWSYV